MTYYVINKIFTIQHYIRPCIDEILKLIIPPDFPNDLLRFNRCIFSLFYGQSSEIKIQALGFRRTYGHQFRSEL